MLKIENTEAHGWEAAIRGMRNPMNSWADSDSYAVGLDPSSSRIPHIKNTFQIRPKDHDLMIKLCNAGTDHRKFMRMVVVCLDITAPLYWWKEFDTYKVGTVANSCSTMHKIQAKEFTLDDFSCEHLIDNFDYAPPQCEPGAPREILKLVIEVMNSYRKAFLVTNDKIWWWQMIQLLPSSYNQRRTVMLNYEVLANIYKSRRNHKLDEWHTFCDWIESLPYSELITGNAQPKEE